jgi:hypothetical protein
MAGHFDSTAFQEYQGENSYYVCVTNYNYYSITYEIRADSPEEARERIYENVNTDGCVGIYVILIEDIYNYEA